MRVAFGRVVVDGLGDGLQVNRRAVADETLAKGPHPEVILIKLLAAGQGAPRDQLMHVGVARVVADRFGLNPRPGGAGDDLARLRRDIAEADLGVMRAFGQMGMVPAGGFLQLLPRLHGHFAVGFGGKHQDHFRRVDRGVQLGQPFRDALIQHHPIQIAQMANLDLGIPVDALAAVAELLQQRTDRGELLVKAGIVPFDRDIVRRGLAGDQVTFALLPVTLHMGCANSPGVSCSRGS